MLIFEGLSGATMGYLLDGSPLLLSSDLACFVLLGSSMMMGFLLVDCEISFPCEHNKRLCFKRATLGTQGGIGVTRGVTADVRDLPRALGGSHRALAQ